MKTSFLSTEELCDIGFQKLGKDVKVSRFAHFYQPEKMVLGDYCRIDDFCILSGTVSIGAYSHISAYTVLYGANGIEIGDFSGLSPRCTIFSAMDDFSGDFLIGPTLPHEYTSVKGGKVVVEKYCQIGASALLFPNITIGEGTVVGAMSLVNKSLDPWGVYLGIPVRYLKPRKKGLLSFEIIKNQNSSL